jgi:adenylosuccinate synthase
LVRRALAVNQPSSIVLNHVDYVDAAAGRGVLTPRAESFVRDVELAIERHVDLVGLGPAALVALRPVTASI